jgi:hypothetical protein
VSPEESEKRIAEAKARDEFAYVTEVAAVLGRARRLRWFPWRRQLRIRLLQVVAELDDYLIEEAVEEARRFLEKRGFPCEPSAKRVYEKYLESMPLFSRHLMLAKQAMLGGAADDTDAGRESALRLALHHYEIAKEHGDLSAKHRQMVVHLRKRLRLDPQ